MRKKSDNLDYSLLLTVGFLLVYGLAALYSASTVQSYQNFGTTTYYIYHQIAYGGILGAIALVICSKIDYHFWQKQLPFLLVISLILLAMVKLSSHSVSSNGAERWLSFGPLSFQPSELAKLVIVFYIASWADKRRQSLNDFYFGILPSLVIIALFAGLIVIQPDLGTMLVLVIMAFAMLFGAGLSMRYFFWAAVAGLLAIYTFIKIAPYRAQRLTSFLNPGIDPKGISYQVNQALLAIGSGSWWGYGYGLSRQKHNYLPEVMNDSIFAVTSEELGFFRVMIIVILFGLLAIQGLTIARRAPDVFGRMTTLGITFWITIQAIINIGAMVNLLPLTGIPLPFFSYGSTALMLNLAAIGILLNISKQATSRA